MYQQLDDDFFELARQYETEINVLRSKNLKDRIKNLSTESTNLKLFKKLNEKNNNNTNNNNNNNENKLSYLSEQLNKAQNIHQESMKILASKSIIDLSSLKGQNVSQKDQNLKTYLQNENNQLEALKYSAYKICSDVSKKIQKDNNQFKQRNDIPQSACPIQEQSSNLTKLGSISFTDNNAQPCSVLKLTVSMKEWQRLREIVV